MSSSSEVTTGTAAGMGGDGVFIRKSSGLIRSAGTLDVFIYGIGLISIGLGVLFNQLQGPSLYPGANVAVSTMIAGLGVLVMSLGYYMWAIIFPRSGGNYVYQSRSVGPAVAFALTFQESFVVLFYSAFAASLLSTAGISAGFAILGLIAHNDSLTSFGAWFATPLGNFISAGIALIVFGAVPLFGMRRFFTLQRVMFVLAVLGTLAAVGVLLVTDHTTFSNNLQALTGLKEDEVIKAAQDKGWAFNGYQAGPTVTFMTWPMLAMFGAILATGIGGEIKQVSRAQFFGMPLAIVVATAVIAIVAPLANHTFGYEFQGAVAYNATADPTHSTPVTPYFTLLAGIASNNVIVSLVIVVGFAAWMYFWIAPEVIYPQRTMLAWAFDRLAPESLAYVSRRFHTPVVAIVVSIVVCLIFLAVIDFTSYGTLVLIMGNVVVWGTTMAAGTLFPWIRRDVYNSSPAARYRLGPLPLMTLFCGLGFLFLCWAFYLLWNDPIAAGHNPVAIGSNLGLLVLGFIIFFIVRTMRRRQGVRVELAFKEIPIE